MARAAAIKNNFSSGVVDVEVEKRVDLEPYYKAARDGTNVVVKAKAGAEDRGGSRTRARIPRVLRRVPLTSGMVTAPNGGTAANLVDKTTSTEMRTASNANTANPFVAASIDLGAAKTLVFADCLSFSCSTGAADAAFFVQTSLDGAAWTDFGLGVNIRTEGRTRRFTPGPGMAVSARYVRAVIKGAPAIGTIGIRELRLFAETTRISGIRRFNFTFSTAETYVLIVSDQNASVFLKGQWKASLPLPFRSDQLEVLTKAQRDDTMLIFHPEVQTRTIFRQGAHHEWDSFAATFSNVPTVEADTAFGAAQDEVQEVRLAGIENADTFALLIDDVDTALIAKSADAGAMATAIAAALEALPNVEAGLQVGVSLASAHDLVFSVRFSGGSNAGRSWPLLFADNHSRETTEVTVSTLQDGRAASGAVMSAATGWPRCGAFIDQRLLVGGFKQLTMGYAASVVNNFFDFEEQDTIVPDDGFLDTLDSDEVVVIHHIFSGRNIQLFTSGSEWYLASDTLDATQKRKAKPATRNGSRPGIEPIQVDGGTQFVQGAIDPETGELSGSALRDFIYVEAEDDYAAESLTLLSAELVSDIVDIAYRRASVEGEGNEIYIANRDGSAAVFVFMRKEKVNAPTPWTTQGKFRAFAVDAARRLFAVVERTAGGQADNWFEEFDPACVLDATERIVQAPSVSVPVPARLWDGDVWAVADGVPVGPFTVNGGHVTLPRAASVVDVGRFYEFRLETMPFRQVYQSGHVDMSPRRIHTVTAALRNTTSAAIAANGSEPVEIELQALSSGGLDLAPLENPVSGEFKVEGLEGKVVGPTATITRPRPGYITVEALFVEAA